MKKHSLHKRVIILAVLSLFLLSTSGLPVTYHLCRMMEEKPVSECEVCKTEMNKIVMPCCAEETPDYAVTVSSEYLVCCQTEFVYNKLEDQFLANKSEVTYFSLFSYLYHTIAYIDSRSDIPASDSFLADASPPFLINPELHIVNSVFLI